MLDTTESDIPVSVMTNGVFSSSPADAGLGGARLGDAGLAGAGGVNFAGVAVDTGEVVFDATCLSTFFVTSSATSFVTTLNDSLGGGVNTESEHTAFESNACHGDRKSSKPNELAESLQEDEQPGNEIEIAKVNNKDSKNVGTHLNKARVLVENRTMS